MTTFPNATHDDLHSRLKWLIRLRILFATLLAGSTAIMQFVRQAPVLGTSLFALYCLIGAIFLLSAVYAAVFRSAKRQILFAYVQIGIDTLTVTLIVFLTGSFTSIFSFLYLVVIVYSSVLLFRKGGVVMASLCCLQYGVMVDLEYYGLLTPFGSESLLADDYEWSQILYKVMITMAACFAVALLSGFLAEQARKSKKKLVVMEGHVKRVEKMAAMGEMAAGLAHEIKNPLASLSGSIQILREDIEYHPEHDKLMQIVLRETDRLSSLLTNFLLFARPPAGRVKAIPLDRSLVEIAELFEKDNRCSGRIQMTRTVVSDIWVEIDPMHLQQVLWNLLLNAAEAIEGPGTVHLEMRPSRNRRVDVTVSDTGCGLSSEIIDSVFDPFFTTKANGTGLGLSIVHSILESYDSRLDVETRVGRGTAFTFGLRQIDAPD